MTLKEALENWADIDSCRLALAIALGLMTSETNYQTDAKHVFWSNHPVGNMLHDFVLRLLELNILEHRKNNNEDEYRWNASFIGSWEKQTPPDYLFPSIRPETLKAFLSTWKEDFDSVQFALAQSLGLMMPDNDFGYTKHVFYSDHPIGHMLYDFLMRLVEVKVLEYRTADSGNQFRWNPSFKGSWEK